MLYFYNIGTTANLYSKIVADRQSSSKPPAFYGSTFLRIPGNGSVFTVENSRDFHAAQYLPINQDLMINMRGIEQLSFNTGVFFTADKNGQYNAKKEGKPCSSTSRMISLTSCTL